MISQNGSADRTPHPAPTQSPSVDQAQRPAWNPHPVQDTEQTAEIPAVGIELDRVPAWIRRLDLTSLPQAISEAQPSLADRVRYSRHGEWMMSEAGGRRRAHLFYTVLFAIPVTVICYFLAWTVERPGRFAFTVAAILALGTVLSQIPFIGWFIPTFIDVTTWF